jgi:hypothetical protein
MASHAIDEGAGARTYRGKAYTLFNEANLSTSWYGQVMDALKRMNCVEMLSRGGGKRDSVWLLFRAPDPMYWSLVSNSQKSLAKESQERILTSLIERIAELERTMNSVLLTFKERGVPLVRVSEDADGDGAETSSNSDARDVSNIR